MKTGRRDSRQSYASVVEDYIPNHNASISLVLSRFKSIGIDVEGVVAILGAPLRCVVFKLFYFPATKLRLHFISRNCRIVGITVPLINACQKTKTKIH